MDDHILFKIIKKKKVNLYIMISAIVNNLFKNLFKKEFVIIKKMFKISMGFRIVIGNKESIKSGKIQAEKD